jgi:hypothetical protein
LRWPYQGIDESEVASLRAIAFEMMSEFFVLSEAEGFVKNP